MSLKTNLAMTRQGFKHIIRSVSGIKEGQTTNFAILQTSHRLEKGLCIRNPRAGWGFDKADQLVDLIRRERLRQNPDVMAIDVGETVLAAYIAAKEKVPGESDKLNHLKDKVEAAGLKLSENVEHGGALFLQKEDVLQDESVESLFLTRHSVRDFSDTPVDQAKLERAVTLALRAPSACNRQATQIYVISGDDRIKAGSSNEYHADKYLIITGNMRAFSLSELNDWIVSSSVFCGYLSLALHAEGIGSCIFRKDIVQESKYNDNIKAMCHISDDEQIILEMAIGNYKDEFNVPVSCRRNASDILHYND